MMQDEGTKDEMMDSSSVMLRSGFLILGFLCVPLCRLW